jgi:hypothetical protein
LGAATSHASLTVAGGYRFLAQLPQPGAMKILHSCALFLR